MKKQILLQENILKKIIKFILHSKVCILLISTNCIAKEKWVIDKDISKITFEVPVLFASDVKGEFKNIDGFVEIDLENKKNNKALVSADIQSIEINYSKYRDLLLSPIFFDLSNFPLALLDTKKFSYENQDELTLDIELTIKGISKMTETKITIKKLTNDIVQILGSLKFSRTDFNIGTGNWKNTTILKDNVKIDANIFLIKD
tara:strand:+ start:1451 stop:2059 length:609 start_codon:yes stop_codon:yes gene_type:complete